MDKNVKVKARAFTLIELLVVISIIALLLSILMPALSKVKGQAKDLVCKAQLHDWGVAFACYGAENNDAVCSAVSMLNGIPVTWDQSLKPYYVNDNIRLCPSAPRVTPDAIEVVTDECFLGTQFGAWDIYGSKGSYGMNGYATKPTELSEQTWSVDPAKCWGNLAVKNASKIPLLADCVWREVFVGVGDLPRPKEAITSEGQLGAFGRINLCLIRRHSKATVNVVFLDSSVQKVYLPDMFHLSWSRDYKKKDVTISWLNR